ncbi:MAG TPA: PfkB family carbohydrate kinase [Acidimicrobiales bacterium]|nr:PfkB family carbohydrate kinase [Acidimicrobiales bacterium]
MSGPITVVGDALLDRDLMGEARRLCPDAPVPVLDDVLERIRPGGAGLAALLLARIGRPVRLVTALACDPAGSRLRALLRDAGVEVLDLGADGPTAEKVRVGARGQVLVRMDSGAPTVRPGPLTPAASTAIGEAAAILVSDYGRGVAADGGVRAALAATGEGRRPLVWDPHPRGAAPVAGAQLVTPNAAEAGVDAQSSLAAVTEAGRAAARAWQASGVAITLGRRGAVLVTGTTEPPLVVPAPAVGAGDPCGAGDQFAAAAACLLADGAVLSEAVLGAVGAASAFVAAGGAARLARPANLADEHPGRTAEPSAGPADGPSAGGAAVALARRVRAAGGTVAATGGCFDILHAGHVALLAAARAQGDCLIVCLNSDASVRRLKGPRRPLQSQEDRRAVLLALGCVDEVEIFDEDTPVEALRRLRPHVFAKGADYSAATLPEAPLLAEWGGQAIVLPCLEGRSTTRVVKEAIRLAHH